MKRNYYTIALIMLTFFVISFLTNAIGPLIPDMIKGFNLSLVLVALLPFIFFIAYGVMSIPSGMLIEYYKEKKMMVIGFIFALAGSLILFMYPNYISALCSLFLIGCGMAILQVAINPLLRVAGGEENYAFYSVLAQLIFGLASFVSPLVYSYMVLNLQQDTSAHNAVFSLLSKFVPAQFPWISLYLIFFIVCLLMIVIVMNFKFPKSNNSSEDEKVPLKEHVELFKNKTVILFFVAIVCYVGTEQGVANWVSQFLYSYHGYDPQTDGAATVAYFWGLMTAGGLLGLVLLKFIDSRHVLILFTALAIVCLSLGLFSSPEISLVAFPMVGFFASVMYPAIFSLALNSVKTHHGAFSGILVTGVIGGAIVPMIIAWIGDNFGLKIGMYFIYITLAYILSVGFWAKPIVNNKTISLFKKKQS